MLAECELALRRDRRAARSIATRFELDPPQRRTAHAHRRCSRRCRQLRGWRRPRHSRCELCGSRDCHGLLHNCAGAPHHTRRRDRARPGTNRRQQGSRRADPAARSRERVPIRIYARADRRYPGDSSIVYVVEDDGAGVLEKSRTHLRPGRARRGSERHRGSWTRPPLARRLARSVDGDVTAETLERPRAVADRVTPPAARGYASEDLG